MAARWLGGPQHCPPAPAAVAATRAWQSFQPLTSQPTLVRSVFLDDFLATGMGEQAPQLEFEQLPFSHPLFIMFSSGTTGAPKCMVHSAGVSPGGDTWQLACHAVPSLSAVRLLSIGCGVGR